MKKTLLGFLMSYALTYTLPAQAQTPQTEAAQTPPVPTQDTSASSPQRIISLSPNTTELIYSLGVEDHLVGVSQFSNYPPEALDKPIVGDAFAVNVEQLVHLQPDLIVAWSTEPFRQHLQHLPNTQTWQSQAQSIQELFSDIKELATLVHSPRQAAILNLEQAIQNLRQEHESSQILQGFLLLSEQPIYVLTQKSIQTDALNLCGAQNSFKDIAQGAAVMSREAILMRPIDFVVYTYSDEQERLSKEDFILNTLKLNLSAKQLIAMDSDTWSRPTVRFLQALPELCQQIDALR